MSKLSYEEKVNLYNDKKKGASLTQLVIKYLVRLIDRHVLDTLRTTKNKYNSIHEKE